jgi:molybdate transport system substrate-binding protein
VHRRLKVWLALCLALGACGRASEPELVVLAAVSLGDAFGAIADDYEASHPVRVLESFAGSQVLAAQLEAGIDADVVALANSSTMRRLESQGLVREPVRFASNRLVWVSRRDADAGLDRIADPGLRVVLAAPEVPAGHYAREALARLGRLEQVESRLVSLELDVKGVIEKLMLAGADAGIAYATDVGERERHVLRAEPLPVEVRASYWVALSRPSAEAERFLAHLLGPAGRQHLAAHGFGTP